MVARIDLQLKVLVGFVLMVVVLLVLKIECSERHWTQPFSNQKGFCRSLEPHYAASNLSSHLRNWMKKRRTRSKNTLLLRCGDVERNPGTDNAARSEKRKGNEKNQLVIIHVNARSLIRHFDNVSLLCLPVALTS